MFVPLVFLFCLVLYAGVIWRVKVISGTLDLAVLTVYYIILCNFIGRSNFVSTGFSALYILRPTKLCSFNYGAVFLGGACFWINIFHVPPIFSDQRSQCHFQHVSQLIVAYYFCNGHYILPWVSGTLLPTGVSLKRRTLCELASIGGHFVFPQACFPRSKVCVFIHSKVVPNLLL